MKKYAILIALFLFAGVEVKAGTDDNDSLGLPGDNLDLYGVLDLFKQSSSLEDFEKKLNDPANEVNNLDLNGDQNVDYIRVVDQHDGDAHAIILQVPVSATESQDVAAIELEKTGAETADIQVVGDEELYGENYVVEAKGEAATGIDQRWKGFNSVIVVNVWNWSCVRFIYAPVYVVWVSPYHWMYYPVYWRPWHPVMWHVHHAHVMHYHAYYVCVHEHRMEHAHTCYAHHRMASPQVHRQYEAQHQRRDANQGHRTAPPSSPRSVDNGQHKNQGGNSNGHTKAPRAGKQSGVKGGQKSGGQNSGKPRGGGQKGGGPKGGGGKGHR